MGRGKATPQDIEAMKFVSMTIQKLLSVHNLKQSHLADLLNIPRSSFNEYVKGTALPRPGNVQKIADYFGLKKSDIDPRFKSSISTPTVMSPTPKVEYIPSTLDKITTTSAKLDHKRQLVVLSTAEDELKEQIKGQEKKHNVISIFDKQVEYDYYDQPASAGSGQYLSDVEVQKIELPVEIDADFVIQVDGVSMEPDYLDDDYVFVKLSYNLSNGDIGVFYYNGNAYIKQLRIDGNKAYLHSLNPDYKDMPITEDTDFRMIGKVVDVYREGGRNF